MTIADFAKMYAEEKHKGQYRKDNITEYVEHPIAVAELVRKYKKSHNIERLVAVAYLHDVLEDTDTTYPEIVDNFGYDVASLVMEVTSIKEMKDAIGKEKYLSYKLKNMTEWALVIKLCDRLHNIKDSIGLPHDRRLSYINETKYIIKYIEENRKLTKTHIKIIEDIMKEINEKDVN